MSLIPWQVWCGAVVFLFFAFLVLMTAAIRVMQQRDFHKARAEQLLKIIRDHIAERG